MCVVIDHPLQSFSRSYFTQDTELCSDAVDLCEAGRMAGHGHIFPSPLVTSGLPEPGEPRALHPHVGKPCLKVVQPMAVSSHRQQGLTNPWEPDAFRPMSYSPSPSGRGGG
jgi:hypothetical protein